CAVRRPAPVPPSLPSTTLFRSDVGHGRDRPLEPLRAEGVDVEVRRGIHEVDRIRDAILDRELQRVHPVAEGAAEAAGLADDLPRSEEHTSELQSRENLVCRLLL